MSLSIHKCNLSHIDFLSDLVAQTRKRVCRIKSESLKCCLLWCWSFSFHGHRCMSSIRLHCSIPKLCIKHLATRPSLTSNYWHTHPVAVIQSPTVSWTEDFVRHAWIYFGVASVSMRPDGSASAAAQSVLLKAVKSHS